jgi:hypothetical protein
MDKQAFSIQFHYDKAAAHPITSDTPDPGYAVRPVGSVLTDVCYARRGAR